MKNGVLSITPTKRRRRLRPALANGASADGGIRRHTAAEQVYRILRLEILSMQRKPGDPINDREIEAALGVSRTPIREAILRLAAENLIEIQPQSGTFVARIPLAALPEAIVIRKTIEELTVRTAAECASDRQIAHLRAILKRQRVCATAGDPMGFYVADEVLHGAIAEIAGYPSSWPLVLRVKAQVDRFCHLTLPQPGRMARLLKEHTAIVDGIAAHDAGRATAALAEHLDRLMAGLVIAPDFDPNYFIGDPLALAAGQHVAGSKPPAPSRVARSLALD
jgi:DNA-binding GntR family transcriptional regulator